MADVWFTWNKRRAECCYCNQAIEVATPMIVTKLWRKGDAENRRINLTFYKHMECFMMEGMAHLIANPYTPGNNKRGPKSKLTPEQQVARRKLLLAMGSLRQQLKKIKADYPDSLLNEARIRERMANLIVEASVLGGVPKSWLEELTVKESSK